MEKIQTLLICDDYWHPGEVIIRGLRDLNPPDIAFDIITDAKDCLTEQMLRAYQVIVNCKCNNINASNTHPWFDPGVTEVGPGEFRAYIEEGGGFLSVHSGNAFFKENDCPEYTGLIGGYFVAHPPRCAVEVRAVGSHPITRGVEPFTIRDEQYQLEVTAEDAIQILETESASGGVQTGGYVRTIGKGRLGVLTPGHNLSVWQNESFRRLLLQSIRWCAGKI